MVRDETVPALAQALEKVVGRETLVRRTEALMAERIGDRSRRQLETFLAVVRGEKPGREPRRE